MSPNLRSLFLIRPDVTFLNHGSFGACSRPVFEEYGRWQRQIEEQPVEFLGRRAPGLLRDARRSLGEYLGCDADDLVYVINATMGVNIVARSLALGPGDEVLATDHEYGACERAWKFVTGKNGASYRQVCIPVPVTTHEDVVERIFAAVTPATRVLFISHITSPTALTFPVAEVCRRARELGIVTLVDGAHVPGQIELNLEDVGADFYVGNLHKWLCAPKGAAFLYARRDMQHLLEPLVISWGWETQVPGDSRFIDHLQSIGTDDISAALTVPAAIRFQQEHGWDQVRAGCHELVGRARQEMAAVLGTRPLAPDASVWYAQMSALFMPDGVDGALVQRRLYEEHRVEIPIFFWNGVQTIRVSIQGYNGWDDVERLLHALRAVLGSLA